MKFFIKQFVIRVLIAMIGIPHWLGGSSGLERAEVSTEGFGIMPHRVGEFEVFAELDIKWILRSA